MKMIDLTGRRFGALVAMWPVPSSETMDGKPGWRVRCDCGRIKTVNGSNLRQGRITSCGCGLYRGQKIRAALMENGMREDVTGQKWNELTAMAYVSRDYWRFCCSCGREITARLSNVKNGKIKSCGHVLAETAREKITKDNTVSHYDGTTVSRLRAIISSDRARGIRLRIDKKGRIIYQARITIRRKTIYIGSFHSFEDAEKARRRAEEKYYLPIIQKFEEEKKNAD